ncbi:hypothetical protein Rs2_21645 [Raphanus sativus]|nr:hypothetical protein Rs2_21645 [Raphanus sativus]
MFVLVRWEPVVHDDYPWIIPFWVEITGIPLHLWTISNLRKIRSKLGHVDTVDLSAGRLLWDIDTRKALVFSRKVASPKGEEVTIKMHYEKLFKHCSTCGMLTHEVAYCPQKAGVFARVQIPSLEESRQSSLRDQKPLEMKPFAKPSHAILPYEKKQYNDHIKNERRDRKEGGFMSDARRSQYPNDKRDAYNDMKSGYQEAQGWYGDKGSGRDDRHVRKIASHTSRYGARYAPYQTKQHQWRAKERVEPQHKEHRIEPYARDVQPATSERSSNVKTLVGRRHEDIGNGG